MHRMRKIPHLVILSVFVATLSVAYAAIEDIPEKNEKQEEQGKKYGGFTNTPKQPDGKWRVHDPNRPQPPVAEPKYDGKPVKAPEGAKILFDGTNTDQWKRKNWPVKDGVMIAGKSQQETLEKFGDIYLHIEWMIPRGDTLHKMKRNQWNQKQGNSGVFLMKRYEIQVLNGWANRTYPDGMVGAIYGQTPPLVNACRKPGEWNAYDIHFKAPVFAEDGKVKEEAYMTAYLNGVLVQDNTRIWGPTSWRKVAKYNKPHGKDVIQLQWHGNKVRYRNIWVAPLKKKLGPDGEKEQDKK